jgi:hypothetical protein
VIGRPIKVVALAAAIVAASLAPLALDACHATPRPIADIIDCTKLEGPAFTAELAKLSALVPDWTAIYQTAIADVAGIGYRVAGCVIADLAQQYLTTKGATATIEETWSAHDALEHFRATQAHGATFRTANGMDL